jgi:proteasome assembly chaperone (PAC2) family protein
MVDEAIKIDFIPDLMEPIFIAGFDGWGNALDISRGMVDYMIRKLEAKPFAKLDPDLFYRFDENRPLVDIENGLLKRVFPPGGSFYVVERSLVGRDIILFKATEPNLRWFHFADTILTICQKTGVKTIVSLGSMFDNVLHTDTVISTLASSEALLLSFLKGKKIITINYKGPGSIHSTIQTEAKDRGVECISLWCHCPYYLQGTTHFGLLSHLGSLLSSFGGFDLDTEELDTAWVELSEEIQGVIDKNPELQGMINDLRKAKIKGSWDSAKRHDKIIHLEDFLEHKMRY